MNMGEHSSVFTSSYCLRCCLCLHLSCLPKKLESPHQCHVQTCPVESAAAEHLLLRSSFTEARAVIRPRPFGKCNGFITYSITLLAWRLWQNAQVDAPEHVLTTLLHGNQGHTQHNTFPAFRSMCAAQAEAKHRSTLATRLQNMSWLARCLLTWIILLQELGRLPLNLLDPYWVIVSVLSCKQHRLRSLA